MLTLKKLVLLALAYMYAPVRGRAHGTSAPKRVAVVQMAKLGDMVCTTPMFKAVRSAYPNAHLCVVGSSINRQVLAHNTDASEYYEMRGLYRLWKYAGEQRFDAVAIAGAPDIFSVLVMFLAGVRVIAAPHIVGAQTGVLYKAALWLVEPREHKVGSYAPGEYLRLLEPMGIHATDTTKHLAYSPEAKVKAEELLAGLPKPVVGISPSAGNKIKTWGADKFAAVARELVASGASLVLFGGARDRAECEAFRAQAQGVRYLDLSEKLSIDELKAAITMLDLFVAVDTGPVYIAEAFGVATVDIVGPMDEREQPPVGERHVVITPPFERVPQLHIMDARHYNYTEARRQTDSITPGAVLKACKDLLSIG